MESKEFDIRITRGSGPGGQHKNKVETCVIITHIPTGLQEKCQFTRSKLQNVKIAKKRLELKIKKLENQKIQEEKKSGKKFSHIRENDSICIKNKRYKKYYRHKYKKLKHINY